jgi:hypothetical protein
MQFTRTGGDRAVDRTSWIPIAVTCLRKSWPEDGIAIAEQVSRELVIGERFAELLPGPFWRRMRGYIEVDHAPAVMSQYEEHGNHLETNGGHGKEVHRDQLLEVIFQKSAQVCDGGLRQRTMHLLTLGWLMAMPSLSRSPWIPGAPQ